MSADLVHSQSASRATTLSFTSSPRPPRHIRMSAKSTRQKHDVRSTDTGRRFSEHLRFMQTSAMLIQALRFRSQHLCSFSVFFFFSVLCLCLCLLSLVSGFFSVSVSSLCLSLRCSHRVTEINPTSIMPNIYSSYVRPHQRRVSWSWHMREATLH